MEKGSGLCGIRENFGKVSWKCLKELDKKSLYLYIITHIYSSLMEFSVQLSIFRVLPKSYPKQGVEVKHQQRCDGQVPARPPALPGCHVLSSPKLIDLIRSLLPVSCSRMQGDNIWEEEKKHPVGTQGSEIEDLEFFTGAGQGQAEGGPGAAQTVPLRTRSPDR